MNNINTKEQLKEHVNLYRIAPVLNTKVEDTVFEKILEKVQDLEAYKLAFKYENKESLDALNWLKQMVENGTCHGQASILVDVEFKEGDTFSLQDRLNLISPEEAIFRQVIRDIKEWNYETRSATIFARNQDVLIKKANSNRQDETTAVRELMSYCRQREQQLKKMSEQGQLLNTMEPITFGLSVPFWSKTNQFSADLAPEAYQIHLEKAINASSIKDKPITGVIYVPEHVMTFQYGPQDYFIYDPYLPRRGGLFKYSDKESFFKGVHLLVNAFMRKEKIEGNSALVCFEIYTGHNSAKVELVYTGYGWQFQAIPEKHPEPEPQPIQIKPKYARRHPLQALIDRERQQAKETVNNT